MCSISCQSIPLTDYRLALQTTDSNCWKRFQEGQSETVALILCGSWFSTFCFDRMDVEMTSAWTLRRDTFPRVFDHEGPFTWGNIYLCYYLCWNITTFHIILSKHLPSAYCAYSNIKYTQCYYSVEFNLKILFHKINYLAFKPLDCFSWHYSCEHPHYTSKAN